MKPKPPVNPKGQGEGFRPPAGPESRKNGPNLPSASSFLHILWLRKWPIAAVWLLLALPSGLLLSVFDLPRNYSAYTVMRFPEVVGAQTNMMRDVAITKDASIITIFTSFQVIEAAVRRLDLRLHLRTPDLFRAQTFERIRYADHLSEGTYAVSFAPGGEARVDFSPRTGGGKYRLFEKRLENGALSLSGLDLKFTPSFLRKEKKPVVELEFLSMPRAVKEIREGLKIRPRGESNYEVSLKYPDPYFVAEVVNVLREEFLEIYYGTTEVQDVGILVQMEKDLEVSKEKLQKSQDELARFYSAHPELMKREEGPEKGDQLEYLEHKSAQLQLAERRKRLNGAMAAKPVEEGEERQFWANEVLSIMAEEGESRASILRSTLSGLSRKEAELKASLGPEHPRLQEVRDERKEALSEIESIYQSLVKGFEARDAEIRRNLAASLPARAARPSVKVELELERLVTTNRNNEEIYDKLLASYNRAKLTTGSEFFKVTVVDPARPALYEPPSLRGRLLIAASAVALLALLVPFFVLAWHALRKRIWVRDDISRFLGLKTLGTVAEKKRPKKARRGRERGTAAKASGKADTGNGKVTGSGVDSFLLFHGDAYTFEDVEAFRLIREEAENFYGKDGKGLCLLVTSTHPAEGKSTCAANLALAFARKGRRTLLIDGDFRLGRVGELFGIGSRAGSAAAGNGTGGNGATKVGAAKAVAPQAEEGAAPQEEAGAPPDKGLDDFLNLQNPTEADFLEASDYLFRATPQAGLTVVPCRRRNPNAAELVGSDRFLSFVRNARNDYEVVIIDTAPIQVAPEGLGLTEEADGILFICRSGVTPVGEALETLDILRDRGSRMAAVLNGMRISPFEHNRYRKYSYYYAVQPKA